MTSYTYREFKISYEVQPDSKNPLLFKASGFAQCIKNKNVNAEKIHFSTESSNLELAQKEIKKIIEDYIVFQWEQATHIKKTYKS